MENLFILISSSGFVTLHTDADGFAFKVCNVGHKDTINGINAIKLFELR